jgi:crossover junction endodeoxyribonuclease RuvC
LIIFGIDPGSRVAGFGIIKTNHKANRNANQNEAYDVLSHGVIVMPEKKSFQERLLVLGQSIQKLLKKYQPDEVAIEKIFLGKNADSAFKLGHARGVAMYECARLNLPISEYATRSIKQSVTGKGSADKEQVRKVVQMLLSIKEIEHLDASDALAVAVHHAHQCSSQLKSFAMREAQL